jgi:hypothetical protein
MLRPAWESRSGARFLEAIAAHCAAAGLELDAGAGTRSH